MPPNNDICPNPQDYAIVIGINGYSQLQPLAAAQRDATEFAQWLLSLTGGGLCERNLRLIVSPSKLPEVPIDAEPVQKQIDRALYEFGVEENVRIGRRLYFYFAGHGFGPNHDNVGMLMANASDTRLKSNIGLSQYRSFFKENHLFDEVIFFLDCCRDPGFLIETAGPDFTLERPPVPPQIEDFIVLGASYGEKAFARVSGEISERRGVLTQAIMEALQGEPQAANLQGEITTSTLRDYLHRRVVELATDEKLKQKPEVPTLPTRDFIFKTITTTVQVQIFADNAELGGGELILRDGSWEQIATKSVDQANPWIYDLRDVVVPYTVEHLPSRRLKMLKLDEVKGDNNVFRFP
jgi:hypothetical protein